jgi:hypothetical protein
MTWARSRRYGYNFADTAASVQDLTTYLTGTYNLYKKPIWLTEFALTDYRGAPSTILFPTYAQQVRNQSMTCTPPTPS